MFCNHLKATGENYFVHFGHASKYGFKLFYAAIVCFFHALIPCMFVNSASNVAKEICDEVEKRSSNGECNRDNPIR
jgi:hypothetical protein